MSGTLSRVWFRREVLRRFMNVVTGGDSGYYVCDDSHLSDFSGLVDLDALDEEFGVYLPTTDLHLYEALELLVPLTVTEVDAIPMPDHWLPRPRFNHDDLVTPLDGAFVQNYRD